MATNNPYKTYEQNSVTTASAGELTIMLYNGCLKFINKAKQAIRVNSVAERNTNIQKAQNIIRELMVTLDMEYEVSKNMMALYEFIYQSLLDANIKNDIKKLEEAEQIVIEFRDTWKQAIQLNRQQQHHGGLV
ncbi:flagellar export chaperone FliS [Bacillus sp. AGMB 02131]|uniref:Flagellar secretion chaperone FliS n=1 Tax=Peribacillus faecalis TaxID=2772559 RepID=A0A927CYX4_9BACI|nr:flagellar export chaperone FliS [Peribacillus faecalis]MBD3108490.1 flagellar export chaperone FliS [Peribacillus faecalis]